MTQFSQFESFFPISLSILVRPSRKCSIGEKGRENVKTAQRTLQESAFSNQEHSVAAAASHVHRSVATIGKLFKTNFTT